LGFDIDADHSAIWKQGRGPETKHGELEHGVTQSQRYAPEGESANKLDGQVGPNNEVGNPHPMPLESSSIRIRKAFEGKLYHNKAMHDDQKLPY